MRTHLYVLDKHEHFTDIYMKLIEEHNELCFEIMRLIMKDLTVDETEIAMQRIAYETLDNIQVNIGILDELQRGGLDIEEIFDKHNDKLVRRKWDFKKMINIHITEIEKRKRVYKGGL